MYKLKDANIKRERKEWSKGKKLIEGRNCAEEITIITVAY